MSEEWSVSRYMPTNQFFYGKGGGLVPLILHRSTPMNSKIGEMWSVPICYIHRQKNNDCLTESLVQHLFTLITTEKLATSPCCLVNALHVVVR